MDLWWACLAIIVFIREIIRFMIILIEVNMKSRIKVWAGRVNPAY